MMVQIGEYTLRIDSLGWTLIMRESAGLDNGEVVIFDLFPARRV